MKILANDGLHPTGIKMLQEAGFSVDTDKIPQDDLMTSLNEYDVILVRSATKIRESLIDASPNLKMIGRGGVGLDNIDVDYAKSKGVLVVNTPAASSRSVAELTFAHLFSIVRFLHDSNRKMPVDGNTGFKGLKKSYAKGIELKGKTMGVIGFGRIGQETIKIGLALGMEVLPVDLYVKDADLDIQFYSDGHNDVVLSLNAVGIEECLSKADVIALHVPFSGGKPILGTEEFEKMKEGTFIINTARGGAIDEEALLAALSSGKVAAAGLDVFENEPTPRSEILNHPNISLSPHIGASTKEAQENIGIELAEKIIAFAKAN